MRTPIARLTPAASAAALSVALMLGILAVAGCSSSGSRVTPTVDSLPGPGELVEVARSVDYQWTGVAATRSGRLFVSYPRWNDPMRWSVAELTPGGGVKPYPNAGWQSWSPGVAQSLDKKWVCVQSVYVDDDDRLWVLDPGSPKFAGVVPGAAKLVRFDLTINQPMRVYRFDDSIAPKNSYLNDVRIDTDTQTAYITDSGTGAIVVLDLKTGDARRVLADHPSTKAEPGVKLTVEGRELRFPDGSSPQIHSDGIALSPNSEWLYYQPITARTLYRVPTAALRDASLPPTALAAKVENLGPSPVTDGMLMDPLGNLYFSSLEEDAIVVRRPDGRVETLVTDPRLSWPDTFTFSPDGTILVTTAQIHRTQLITGKPGKLAEPYRVFAFRQAGP